MKKLLIILMLLMISYTTYSESIIRKKWDKLSEDEKYQKVQELVKIANRLKNNVLAQRIIIESQEKKIKFLQKSVDNANMKKIGIIGGIEMGVNYTKEKTFETYMAVNAGIPIFFFERIMLVPGIRIHVYRTFGIGFLLQVGFLF